MPTGHNDFQQISERLIELEMEEGFFEIKVRNCPVWERIRHGISQKVLTALGAVGQAHTQKTIQSSPLRYLDAAWSGIRSSGRRNPFFTGTHEFLFFGHKRRKQLEDGVWWDIYCDPIYEGMDIDYLHLEDQYLNDHLTPAKTRTLRYTDLVRFIARFCRKSGLSIPDISDSEMKDVKMMEQTINEEFGTNIQFSENTLNELLLREPLQKLYTLVIRQISPEIAVVVCSYGKEAFIETCQSQDVPVIELQHGIIHPYHFGYSYPGDREKSTFPDYLFTFGDYWSNVVEFPIPDDNVVSVGYPYLEMQRDKYSTVDSRDQILFISQGTIGEELSRFALAVHMSPEIDREVVYKLHPGEYDRWESEYPWLKGSSIRVIDSSTPPLYQLFAESSAQVGVGSTAVYEGLAFGLETFVYDCPGSQILQPLVDDGAAQRVSTVEQFYELMDTVASTSYEVRDYFQADALENIQSEFERLLA